MNTAITVVSGLPRSGTSMMMKMLQAGGLDLLADDLRAADEDNPKGYFEDDRVKRLHKDSSWIQEAQGKVIKVISLQLFHLPAQYQYRVVFMERKLEEIIKSQNEMLNRRNQKAAADDQTTLSLYEKHLVKVRSWLEKQNNFSFCRISFNRMLADSRQEISHLVDFLDQQLAQDRMIRVVEPALYRKK